MSNEENQADEEAQRAALLALLLEEQDLAQAARSPQPSIAAREDDGPAPLSFAQERIWFLDQLTPDSALFVFSGAFALTGALNINALRASFEKLFDRHALLRSRLFSINGTPYQEVMAPPSEVLDVVDLSATPVDKRRSVVEEAIQTLGKTSFDLSAPPLMRAQLVTSGTHDHWLIIASHHAVFDDISFEIFYRDLRAFYAAELRGEAVDLPSLPIAYSDYAAHQRSALGEEAIAKHLRYWVDRLGGTLPVLDLPTDFKRPQLQNFDGARHSFAIARDTSDGVRRLAKALQTTPYVVLLTCFKLTLQSLSRQSDILVGTPFNNRQFEETENLIGLFLNTVVLRTELSAATTLRMAVEAVRDTVLDATEHQDVPFERIVEALHPERDRSRSPIFQAMFVFLNAQQEAISLDGLSVAPIPATHHHSEMDLSLYLRDDGDRLSGSIEYATALFQEATAASFAALFTRFVEAVVAAPDSKTSEINLLTPEQRQTALVTWNDTAAASDQSGTLLDMFAQMVAATPDSVAVRCADQSLTYRQLAAQSDRLAQVLCARGVAAQEPVGVMLPRTSGLLIALLGILKAGGAYVPIDPDFPPHRIEQMVADSGLRFIVGLNGQWPDLQAACIDLESSLLQPTASDTALPSVDKDQLAYIIYTSGSTGRPKGVALEHRQVANLLNSIIKRPGLSQHDVLLAVTTVSFDIHVLELFAPLVSGGCVYIAAREDVLDGASLAALIARSGATVVQATPSGWQLLIDSGWEGKSDLRALCGGEGWPETLAAQLLARCAEVWNMYGPTETCVWSAVKQITDGQAPVTIGGPIDNTSFFIVNAAGQPVPIGVPGELWIGGSGLARGYHNQPELTQQRFVRPSFDPAPPRVYRTGDLARYRGDGDVQVLGRIDNQVKLRGYRIELGDVESCFLDHDAVQQAVATIREDTPGDQRLVVYLTAYGTYRPEPNTMREHARAQLPVYMVPSHIVWLDELPLTPNRKVDRKALPIPQDGAEPVPIVGPMTPMEEVIAEIFKDLLGVTQVTQVDNFFDLGGHSLLSLKVVDAFEKRTGLRMSPGELFQQTVAQLAAWHSKQADQPAQADAAANTAEPAPTPPRKGLLGRLFKSRET